jgi:hypothetical protein
MNILVALFAVPGPSIRSLHNGFDAVISDIKAPDRVTEWRYVQNLSWQTWNMECSSHSFPNLTI